jgi:predicted lipoprotein with Yx(FWY)xxD motif
MSNSPLEVPITRNTTIRYGTVVVVVLVLGAIAAAFALASSSGSSKHTKVAGTTRNTALHETILVDRRGRSLYALSVERHGRFVCTTMACLSFWTPLTVSKGVKPAGVSGLGTVRRPDGKIQVAYHGAPLYTFYLDRRRGDVKGNGFKDVGTWHAVAVSKSRNAAAVTPARSYGY